MAHVFHFKCILKCRLQFISILTSLKFCLVMGNSFTRLGLFHFESICKLKTQTGSKDSICQWHTENTLEKGDSAGYRHFLGFPEFFWSSKYETDPNWKHLQINSLPNNLEFFTTLVDKTFENIMGKVEYAGTQQCFLPYKRHELSFLLHRNWRLWVLSVWTGVKFCCVVKW